MEQPKANKTINSWSINLLTKINFAYYNKTIVMREIIPFHNARNTSFKFEGMAQYDAHHRQSEQMLIFYIGIDKLALVNMNGD
ncbi:hypothetical protein ACFLWZ_01305 [Chloroflexota bacterium]